MQEIHLAYEERSGDHPITPNSVFLFAGTCEFNRDRHLQFGSKRKIRTEKNPKELLNELERKIEEATGLKPQAIDYFQAVKWDKQQEFLNLPRNIGYLNLDEAQRKKILDIYDSFLIN